MRRRYFLFACLLWGAPSLSQTMDAFSGAIVFLYRTEQRPALKDGKPIIQGGKPLVESRTQFGTGFLVSPDGITMILVTAGHVAADIESDFHAVVRGDNDTPVDMRSEDLTGAKNVAWVFHDKEDVAVTILHPSNGVIPKLVGRFIPEKLISSDTAAPSRDRPLTTLGFPLALGVAEHFSPISRESKPASGLITLARFDTKKPATFFLLGDPSVAGFSGAPLLLTAAPYAMPNGVLAFPETGGPTGAAIHCVGIVHGTINDETGGKMAAITPSLYIRETIDKATHQ